MTSTFLPPAEWAPHDAVWIGFPGNPEEWPAGQAEAQRNVAAFADAVHAGGKGERVELIARSDADAETAQKLVGPGVNVSVIPFGDIWLRDTGPIVVSDGTSLRARGFGFNGWGGKYVMAGDEIVPETLSERAGLPFDANDWILEGGAIDGDGTGLAVTTAQCLLHPNRNAGVLQEDIERWLASDLGIDRLLWLGQGLMNDHTDGHVDNLARFVAPGVLAIPEPAGSSDPNRDVYADAARRARAFGVEVTNLPSPGRFEQDGEIVPASYMNFYIGNAAVVVPTYGRPNDDAAVRAIGALFPDREAVGVDAQGVIRGGGSFHCCSQQLPAL
ncbi:agmatine deiminase family protein [Novosphingopyxis iocasae]|uniref:agmatine deiminase family protein n=1 Tax=Novosphingopyxis iocasae TaxID=2762729 RepID=UPI0016516ECB|nr:agmatine deiminase family protein [Novosphingopyxis iocasae]